MTKALRVQLIGGQFFHLAIDGIQSVKESDTPDFVFIQMSKAKEGPILVRGTVAEIEALLSKVRTP